jgi:hypothetical protein
VLDELLVVELEDVAVDDVVDVLDATVLAMAECLHSYYRRNSSKA